MALQHAEADDEVLFDAWKAGNASAGDVLVRRHSPALRSFLRKRRPWEVDEAVQDVWLAMASGRDRFEGRCSIRTFLFAIARNQSREAMRRRLRRLALDHEPIENVAAPEPVSEIVHTAYDARKVVDALSELPDALQQVIVLYYFECLTAVRIGELLDIPENTVRSRVRRAKQRLREALDQR